MSKQIIQLELAGFSKDDKCEICHGIESVGHYSFRLCRTANMTALPPNDCTKLYSRKICAKCTIRDYPRLYVKDKVWGLAAIGIGALIFVMIPLGFYVLTIIGFMKPGEEASQNNLDLFFLWMAIVTVVLFSIVEIIGVIEIYRFKSKLKQDEHYLDKLWDNSTQRERFETFICKYLTNVIIASENKKEFHASQIFPIINADISTCDYCGTRKYGHQYEFCYGDETVTTKTMGTMTKTLTMRSIGGRKTFKICNDCIRKYLGERKYRKITRLNPDSQLWQIHPLLCTILTKIVIAEFGMRKVWSPWEEKEIRNTSI